MTNPNPVAPKTDTPATQIPEGLKRIHHVCKFEGRSLAGGYAAELIERIAELESTLAAERAEKDDWMQQANLGGARTHFTCTANPKDHHTIYGGFFGPPDLPEDGTYWCEVHMRHWLTDQLAAERASRLQAEDQAWNKAVIQGIKKMIHWNPATDQEPDDVLRELLRPCTPETHIWNSGECMACDVVKDRLKFAKPSVSPEQIGEQKMSKLKIGEKVLPLDPGSEQKPLTISGRETHNHYEFYRVKEIPGALFLSRSLSRIKGSTPAAHPAPSQPTGEPSE